MSSDRLFLLLGDAILLCLAILVAKFVVRNRKALGLLLHGLQVAVLLGQLLSKLADLPSIARVGQLLGLLSGRFWVAFVLLDFLLKTEHIQNHGVCSVEDQREEEGETAQVHVALRVELAGLDFHTLMAHHRSSANGISFLNRRFGLLWGDLRALLLLALCELHLHTIDAVHAVNEQNQDEDKSYLHPVL